MRKLILLLEIFAIFLATIVSGVAWIINLFFAIGEISKIKQITNLSFEIGQFFGIRKGSLLFYISTVDLSTVTTLVVLITLLWVIWGIWKVFFAVKNKRDIKELHTEHFPFFPKYQTIFVQLGLLGTLWGFIIAFKQTSVGGSYDPKIIYQALGTALWSTFAAIFLAFVVCPVVSGLFNLLFAHLRNIPVVSSNGDLTQTLVEEDIQAVSDKFRNLSEQINTTTGSLEKLTKEVYNLSVERALGQLSSLQKDVDSLQKDVEEKLKTIVNKIGSMDQKIDTWMNGEASKFREITNYIEGVEKKVVSQNERVTKMTHGLRAVLGNLIEESPREL